MRCLLMSMPLYRRLEKNAQLLEFKCVEFFASRGNEMKHRFLTSTAALAFTLAIVSLVPAPAAGQSRPAPPKKWTPPRTPDGQPDLRGIWTNATITPFERPKEFAGKEYFTEQEAAEYEKKVVAANDRDRRS